MSKRETVVAVELELDEAGVGELLKSTAMARMVSEAANKVAVATGVKGARAHGYTTDRRAAAVSVPAEAQAKDGALTRAAAAVGLTVVGKGSV